MHADKRASPMIERLDMTVVDLVREFAEDARTGVLVTDTDFSAAGPKILYANPAIGPLTGHTYTSLIGRSPKALQGKATSPFTRKAMGEALRAGRGFHTCLTNYRADGEAYLCEIDIRPLRNDEGKVEAFIAFEREVERRRVRARPGKNTRYRPVDPATEEEAVNEFADFRPFQSPLD